MRALQLHSTPTLLIFQNSSRGPPTLLYLGGSCSHGVISGSLSLVPCLIRTLSILNSLLSFLSMGPESGNPADNNAQAIIDQSTDFWSHMRHDYYYEYYYCCVFTKEAVPKAIKKEMGRLLGLSLVRADVASASPWRTQPIPLLHNLKVLVETLPSLPFFLHFKRW